LEPQVDVGSAQGVDHASRPDFMLRPLAGAPMARPVAVFCDGLAYHVKPTEPFGGLADDLRKRKDLIATGKHAVWSVTWKDLDDFEATGPAKGRPTLFSAVSRQTLEKMAPGLGVTLPATAHELGSLGLLEIYLRRPEPLQWRLLAQATLLALLGKPFPEMPALLRLGDRLWEEPAAFAPGPIGLLDAPPAILGRVLDGRPWLLGVVRVPLSALQQRKSSEVRVLLRLFDEAEGRRAPEFEEAWRTFLAGWNLLQFHEGTEVLSSEWLDSEGEFPVAEPLVAEPQPAAYASDALSELLDLADPAVHGLLRSVAEASLPLPEVGFEVSSAGRVVGELELAWPDRLVAVGAQEVPGWQVLPLSVTPDDLLLHLNPGGS
jgi:DEAD/DEAH box helicase domain-containing protein